MAVGLDLEADAAFGDALHHAEEVGPDHGLAAGERDVGHLGIDQLVDNAKGLLAGQ